jgi:hypothetical protein
MTKREVYGALVRVSRWCAAAAPRRLLLPAGRAPTAPKVGLDDYLAEHGLDALSALHTTVLRDPRRDLELVNRRRRETADHALAVGGPRAPWAC